MRLLDTELAITTYLLLAIVYFVPAALAWLQRRQKVVTIFLLNLLLGWTVLGWIAALVWALFKDSRPLEDVAPPPRVQARRWMIAATAVVALCLMIQIAFVYFYDSSIRANGRSPRPTALDPNSVAITRYVLRKDTESQTVRVDFTIRNNNGFGIKDVVLKCTHATLDGNVIDSNTRTIDQIIKPHSEIRLTNFDIGSMHSRTANSSCVTTTFGLAE